MCVFRQQHKERMNRTCSAWLIKLCQPKLLLLQLYWYYVLPDNPFRKMAHKALFKNKNRPAKIHTFQVLYTLADSLL